MILAECPKLKAVIKRNIFSFIFRDIELLQLDLNFSQIEVKLFIIYYLKFENIFLFKKKIVKFFLDKSDYLFMMEFMATLSEFSRSDSELEQLKISLLEKVPKSEEKTCPHISISLKVDYLIFFLFDKSYPLVRNCIFFYCSLISSICLKAQVVKNM